jgi:hypothetical protein
VRGQCAEAWDKQGREGGGGGGSHCLLLPWVSVTARRAGRLEGRGWTRASEERLDAGKQELSDRVRRAPPPAYPLCAPSVRAGERKRRHQGPCAGLGGASRGAARARLERPTVRIDVLVSTPPITYMDKLSGADSHGRLLSHRSLPSTRMQ